MAYITLNKNNLFYNFDIIADKTKSKDKVAVVLKDNAYGHGLCEVAKMAQEYGISKAVVRSHTEAEAIYEYFDYILVLAEMPQKADEKIHYTINDIKLITKFPKGTKVELKTNSGMHRNGVELEELENAFALIKENSLDLKGVFTHHSSADEEGDYFSFQKQNFSLIKQKSKELAEQYGYTLAFHSANSAALFREENFDEDMARIGIATYGCLELPSSLPQIDLKPVLSIYAEKNSSRILEEGDCVGYGANFKSTKKQVVSNYDFGYGDGFLRACSNIYKTPENVSIAGKISMDNSSFLSDKDELLIFNDARDIAKFAGTISYELLTSLKSYIPRKIV
ncbi:alanine racemase [Sulfurimonas marina]|uniref:Alanine racemase n=1 Tax=Sulfurimonas marina TaxID=2590551 RepID=A0A7M3V9Q6_9BACT|nr:alanine racemase [Sulfurimonas marina]QOP40489.1 alanine racemase [Sulfurimonas marina]